VTGEQKQLRLGNLDARRDWGHARDYVKAMQAMLQLDEPIDVVVGTGEAHSVREFLDAAFGVVGLNWEDYVVVDPKFFRPAEVDYLCADTTKITETVGWVPETTFTELVEEMVTADMAAHGLEA
jgi:GDPmannose 4,6-dehydratase